MLHKILVLLILWLFIFSQAGAANIESKIANARGREKLDLIMQLFQGSGKAPDEKKAGEQLDRYTQEALILSKQFHDRHAEGIARKYLAYAECLRQQHEQALEEYFQSRRIFRDIGDKKDEAAVDKAISDLFSLIYYIFSDYGRAGDYYRNSLASFRLSKDQTGIVKSLNCIADIYRSRGDFAKAIPLYLEALQLNESKGIFYDSDDILCNLSDVYLKSGNTAESTKYMQQSLVFSRKKRQNQITGRLLSEKGLSCMQQDKFSQARDCFMRAAEIHKKYSGALRTSIELNNLGLLHARFKQKAKAQEYFTQALELRQQRSDQTEIVETVLAHAVRLQKQNELPMAEALLLFCESKARQNHLQNILSEIYLQWSLVYSLRHDTVNALYYETLGKKQMDALPKTKILAGIQKLIAKTESDREIDKFKTQKRRQTVIGILAICMLFVLTGILAWKRKSIKRWSQNHLVSKDQQLQKKKAQLLDMRQKLDELQDQPCPGKIDASPPGSNGRGREYLQSILQHMKQDKLFLDSELTLKKMAAKIGVNTSYLSKAINEYSGMGFNDFVNHFRIEETKKIMAADDQNEWDMIDICYEVGFNSLSSFYRIFKMHTGMTPMEYQRTQKP